MCSTGEVGVHAVQGERGACSIGGVVVHVVVGESGYMQYWGSSGT